MPPLDCLLFWQHAAVECTSGRCLLFEHRFEDQGLLFIMMQRKYTVDRASATGGVSCLSSKDGQYQCSEVSTPMLSPRLPTSRICRLSDEGLAHEEHFWQSDRGRAPACVSALPWSDRTSRGDEDNSCHDADTSDSPQHSPSMPQSMAASPSIAAVAPPEQWGPVRAVPPEVQCSTQVPSPNPIYSMLQVML